VLLWPDTFNNYLHPNTAKATVEVLEAAGFEVLIPERPLCCGRPLYDYGMLDLAERLLHRVLDSLRPLIREGVPLVAAEPSCLAVFRDELLQMLPDDEDAKRLAAQSFTLAELLATHAPGFELAAPPRMAVVCFRALPRPGDPGEEDGRRADELNRALVEAVNATGRAYLTHTTLRGRVAARVAFGNVLTTEHHALEVLALLEAEATRLRSA